MLGLWLKLIKRIENRLVRVAYDQMLKSGLNTSWSSQIKSFLEKVDTNRFGKPGTIYIR